MRAFNLESPTLQAFFRVPELLELVEVLVEDEDFGDAQSGGGHLR